MKRNLTKILTLFLCILLALTAFSCSKKDKLIEDPEILGMTLPAVTGEESFSEGIWKDATYLDDKEFGEGKKRVDVIVDAEGKKVIFTIYTDKKILAEALLEHKLVEGEEGPFGLYIKKVNGMTADYDVDQSYWAFCKDGEMQMTGVSEAKIQNGDRFELVYTK